MADQQKPSRADVDTALAALAETHRLLAAIEAELADQLDNLEDELTRYGAQLTQAGEPVDKALVGDVYWGAPEMWTTAIAAALGLRSPNDVPAMAGSREFEIPCPDCGVAITHHVRNRTQLAELRTRNPTRRLKAIPNRCERCSVRAEQLERQRVAALETERRMRDRVEARALRRAMEDYVLAHPDLPEQPTTGGTMYVDISVDQWGGSTVTLAALNDVRRQMRDRLSGPSQT